MGNCHWALCPFTLRGCPPCSFPIGGVLLCCPVILPLGPPALVSSLWGRLPCYIHIGAACPIILTLGPPAYSHWGRLPCYTHAGLPVPLYSHLGCLPCYARLYGCLPCYTHTGAASPLYPHWGRLPCYTRTGAACPVILSLGPPSLLYSHWDCLFHYTRPGSACPVTHASRGHLTCYTRTRAASPLSSHWGRLPCYTHTGVTALLYSLFTLGAAPSPLYSAGSGGGGGGGGIPIMPTLGLPAPFPHYLLFLLNDYCPLLLTLGHPPYCPISNYLFIYFRPTHAIFHSPFDTDSSLISHFYFYSYLCLSRRLATSGACLPPSLTPHFHHHHLLIHLHPLLLHQLLHLVAKHSRGLQALSQ